MKTTLFVLSVIALCVCFIEITYIASTFLVVESGYFGAGGGAVYDALVRTMVYFLSGLGTSAVGLALLNKHKHLATALLIPGFCLMLVGANVALWSDDHRILCLVMFVSIAGFLIVGVFRLFPQEGMAD